MSDFYEKYLRLCRKIEKTPSGVAKCVGLSNAAATGWKNGKKPSDITLQKIADYFGVSVDYLKGEEEKKENPGIPKDTEVDEVTMQLMDIIQNSTLEDRQVVLEMFQMLKRRGKR